MNKRTLWLHDPGLSSKQAFIIKEMIRKQGLNPANMFFTSIQKSIPKMWVAGNTKVPKINMEKKADYLAKLDELIDKVKPSALVINDYVSLKFVCGGDSLNLCRGSIFTYRDIPCIVLDKVTSLLSKGAKDRPTHYMPWVFKHDLRKLKRWLNDEQYIEPKFSYTVCDSAVSLTDCLDHHNTSVLCSCDIETSSGCISVVGVTNIGADGSIHSYVIPFINPLKEECCHWETEEDEAFAWNIVRKMMASDVVKTFQNGTYDCSYFVQYNIAVNNYLLDTINLWHCLWAELPKKLNFLSSILLDYCRYWKDENKGDKQAQDKADRIPTTERGYKLYLRYNALDCYNTALNTLALLRILCSSDWALKNYETEFKSAIGWGFAMSMRGMMQDSVVHYKIAETLESERVEAERRLSLMVDEPIAQGPKDEGFNPNSDDQVASLLYDVIGCKPIKRRGQRGAARSVDKRMLRIIETQHPLYAMYIKGLFAVKEARNNYSKYGNLRTRGGRFMYDICPHQTKFGRAASRQHNFRIGTNAQNMPKKMRDMLVADKGYFLLETDYSQSDAYFVAFSCQDPKYIETMTSGKDTHSVHAEHFFKRAYEEVYNGHLAEEEWVEHPITGVRQVTKKIVHGSNFRMAAFTLYTTMGHESVVGAAERLGFVDAINWTQYQAVKFCEALLGEFLALYPGLAKWFKSSAEECATDGNKVELPGGRTHIFFGEMLKEESIQRQLSSSFGQGGTAGNLNATLNDLYYHSGIEKEGAMLLLQVHDSILTQVPLDKIWLVDEIIKVQTRESELHGRKFTVPVDAKCGYYWGKGMVEYHKGITAAEIMATKGKLEEKYYG